MFLTEDTQRFRFHIMIHFFSNQSHLWSSRDTSSWYWSMALASVKKQKLFEYIGSLLALSFSLSCLCDWQLAKYWARDNQFAFSSTVKNRPVNRPVQSWLSTCNQGLRIGHSYLIDLVPSPREGLVGHSTISCYLYRPWDNSHRTKRRPRQGSC